MSFIIKRERIFNSGDLFDLPARNEGKLKAFASCTDTRAWSHFVADQSEHLMEIIKRNNEMCRPKYIPTDVIVSTLMGSKNHEIVRLKRKIAEFEQMLAVYDQLDLTLEQKKEIAVAQNAIRAANKDLDDLCLDLDLSGFTGGDTESYRTGKSGGDASQRSRDYEVQKMDQLEFPEYVDKNFFEMISGPHEKRRSVITCEMSTNITDPRLDELSDTIIVKDATLNAMNNTIAALESDAYEPYCLYAHIYTALEKILAILCQNDEYKRYLHLLSTSQEEVVIDIKGKILLKLKVLEKFSIALIAPCSQKSKKAGTSNPINQLPKEIEAYAVTLSDLPDTKRHDLIYDIMNSDDVKSVYDKNSEKQGNLQEYFSDSNLDIETNNLNRLKNLQINYDELMAANEKLRDECNRLQSKCANYDALESEVEKLKDFVKDYNNVLDEKENFKRRSKDLDLLKEQFFVLARETETLENQLMIESEMNAVKSSKIMEIASVNSNLEQKISNITMSFDKDKNSLECKLKEAECKILCQEQQIKSMSDQIDRLLKKEATPEPPDQIFLLNEIKRLKEVIDTTEKNVRDLEGNLKEKEEYLEKLNIEEGNQFKQSDIDKLQNEINNIKEMNLNLVQECEDKTKAVDNLMGIINNKSTEINKLLEDNEQQKTANNSLKKRITSIQKEFNIKVSELEIEKQQTFSFLELAKQESEHLLNECQVIKQSSSIMINDLEELKRRLKSMTNENEKLQIDLDKCHIKEYSLMKQIEDLELEKMAFFSELDSEKRYSNSLEDELNKSLNEHNDIKNDLKILREKNSDLSIQNKELLNDLHDENLSRRQSEELLEKIKEREVQEKVVMQKELQNKDLELKYITNSYNFLKEKYEQLQLEYDELKLNYDKKIADSLSIEANVSTSSSITSIKRDNVDLRNKVDEYQEELNKLQAENDKLNKTIELMAKEYEVKVDDYDILKYQFETIEEKNKELAFKNDTLENTLINTKNELNSDSFYRLLKEVETTKKEKLLKQLNVEKNDESIENLTKSLTERDNKITSLENYINDLKEELLKLQDSYDELLETSEKIKEISLNNIDNSLKNVEEKYTQYTADVIKELDELKKANEMLEKQASNMKKEAIDSSKQNKQLHAQLKQMEDDKKQISDNLHQLQIETIGGNSLNSDIGTNDNILQTIKNIRKSIDANHSETSLLKNKLLNVRTSSQLIQIKADEAINLAEKEKSKILIEKEEAIKDKLNLEKQLKQLKEALQSQSSKDAIIIEELKSKIDDQNKLMDKIKESNDQAISKLNEDLAEIQELYRNTLNKLEDLQAERLSSDKENNIIINNVNNELKEKIDEVEKLQRELNLLRKKSSENVNKTDDKSTQSDDVYIAESSIIGSYEMTQALIDENKQPYRKELQVLTATIETDNKFINGKYDSEKLKDITLGPMNLLSFINDTVEQPTSSSENNDTESSTVDNKGNNELIKDFQKDIQIIQDNQTDFENSNSGSQRKGYSNDTTDSHIDEQADNLNSDMDITFDSYKDSNIPHSKPTTNNIVRVPLPKPLKVTHSDTQISAFYENVNISNMENILTDDIYLNVPMPSVENTVSLEPKYNSQPNNYTHIIENNNFVADVDVSKFKDKGVYVKLEEPIKEYEEKIRILSDELISTEMEYKKKMEAIKKQYDRKNNDLLNEYKKSIESLIISRDIELDSLAKTSIEAEKKAEYCEKENNILKNKLREITDVDKEPVKLSSRCCNKKKGKLSIDLGKLTKTDIQALDVQAKSLNTESCTCTQDFNVNETIRNIFAQVDASQKQSESEYLKYIVDKIIKSNINALNARELSFLHLNVCRIWRTKICENENDSKFRFGFLDSDFNYPQQLLNFDHLMEERNRMLNMVRVDTGLSQGHEQEITNVDKRMCYCPPNTLSNKSSVVDVVKPASRPRRKRTDNHNRAILVKLEPDDSRTHDDPPTKLKKCRVTRK